MDDAEARAILRAHQEEPPVRGKLGPDWVARATHYADQDTAGQSPDNSQDNEPELVITADEPAAAPVVAERKPRRVATGKPRQSLRDRLKKATTPAPKSKKKHPRMSLAPVIGEFWGLMGSLAGRVDVPLGRCLQMQSPVAGEILEDVVKGTMVDNALQPLARAEDKAKAVGALLLPPLCVVAIEHAQTLPEDQKNMRMAFLEPVLVQSLMMWERVAGDKMEAMAERVAAEAPSVERAKRTAALIFDLATPPTPAPEPETVGV